MSVADAESGAGHWIVGRGAHIDADGTRFVFGPTDGDVNVTFSTESPLPGGEYAITFRCRGERGSSPRVYVTEGSPADLGAGVAPLAVYPNGAGYACPSDGDWSLGGFLFNLPASANITVWLRNVGPEAMFEAVRLEPVAR